jgi:hypothetical protein
MSSGLHFLTSEDFHIARGTKGNILCTQIPGFSLILFYSTNCDFCKALTPIFKKLPGTIGHCQFGMINVQTNKQCVIMSKETIAPITVVPYIILYVDGKPYMRYKGPYVQQEISKFVLEVAQKVQKQEKFTKADTHVQKSKNSIPQYTIGHPLCGEDDVCYLDFNEAYGGSAKPTNQGPQHRSQLPSQAGMAGSGRNNMYTGQN